jgi:hypothetical protein
MINSSFAKEGLDTQLCGKLKGEKKPRKETERKAPKSRKKRRRKVGRAQKLE